MTNNKTNLNSLISKRYVNALRKKGITTVEQLAKQAGKPDGFKNIRGCGENFEAEVSKLLQQLNIEVTKETPLSREILSGYYIIRLEKHFKIKSVEELKEAFGDPHFEENFAYYSDKEKAKKLKEFALSFQI